MEPFGKDMGWRTVTGWAIVIVASVGLGFASIGDPLGIGIGESQWAMLIGVGAGWAGIGQRKSNAKQMSAMRFFVDALSRTQGDKPQAARPGPGLTTVRKGARR